MGNAPSARFFYTTMVQVIYIWFESSIVVIPFDREARNIIRAGW